MADQMTPSDSQASAGKVSSAAVRSKPSIWQIYFPGNVTGERSAVYLASFPPIIYFWPTIVMAFLCAFLQGVAGLNPVAVCWWMIAVVAFNFLVLVQDFDQKQFVILVLVVVSLALAGWVVTLLGFHFLRAIVDLLARFSPSMSVDAYFVFGLALGLLFLWGIITPLFSYWEFEQNEFIHFTRPIGRDMSIARAGCSVYKDIPDMFECLLSGGGGRLIIKRDDQVLASIPHIPFLAKRMIAIEHMLSETRVVVENPR